MKKILSLLVPLLAIAAADSKHLQLRPEWFMRQTDANDGRIELLNVSMNGELQLTRGYRYEIGITSDQNTLKTLFGTDEPLKDSQSGPLTVLLVPQFTFRHFFSDPRTSDQAYWHRLRLQDIRDLYREFSVAVINCPTEITYITRYYSERSKEIKHFMMLSLCTGDSFLDFTYNVADSTLFYHLVVMQNTMENQSESYKLQYFPLLPSVLSFSFADIRLITLAAKIDLPFPMSAGTRELIQLLTNKNPSLPDILMGVERKKKEGHHRLTELVVNFPNNLQQAVSGYILDPRCPWYSSFTGYRTAFPYYLRSLINNDELLNRLTESLRYEMEQFRQRFIMNAGDKKLSEYQLAGIVFKTTEITVVHLSRLSLMYLVPASDFFNSINSVLAIKE